MPKKNGQKPVQEPKHSREFEEIRERIADIDEQICLADGFEEALIGYADGWFSVSEGSGASRGPVALYDLAKCIEILVKRDGMTYDEAQEFIDYNVTGAYVGEKTPVFATILRKEYIPKKPSKRKK